MKYYDKNKESSYLKYLDINNLYGKKQCQRLPVGGFKWAKNESKFIEDFIKNYNEDSGKVFFLELMFSILKSYLNFTMIYRFHQK